MPVIAERQLRDDIPGRVAFLDGKGDLPMIEVSSAWSTAEIYLNGAHVTHFQKKEEPPLLFMSRCSRFTDQPQRTNSTASQSSNSGWLGRSPRRPKLSGDRTRPSPNQACQMRFTVTRAVNG